MTANPIDRMLGAIVPRAVDTVDVDHLVSEVDVNGVVQRVDIDGLMTRVDIDALMARVDIDGLIARVDMDAVLSRVDVDSILSRTDISGILDRIDLNALMAKVDVNALISQVDMDAVLARVNIEQLLGSIDIDALIARIDLDALIDRIDMPKVMERAKIDEIVSQASRGMTARLLDLVRRQLAAVDLVLIGVVSRIFRRPREAIAMAGSTLTGRIAGGVTRLAAFLLDIFTISLAYSFGIGLVVFLLDLFTGHQFALTHHGLAWLIGYATFAGLYYWIGLTVTGRSVGKGLFGLRVVGKDNAPLSPRRAAVRTIVYPFSFILCLGLIPIVTGKRRRALHDWAAGTTVVYDWGDRPAELPGPLTDWLDRHRGDNAHDEVAAEVVAPLVGADATAGNGHRPRVTTNGSDATPTPPTPD
jgi:uncharacterized RDD family membrane protein YckC